MAFTKFLNPKNDLAFKRIFGTEKNKDILIHFLNDFLPHKEHPILEVTFLPTIQDPEIAILRTSVVDVMCKDSQGNQFIVEMQVGKQDGFEKRAQYYASKAYIQQHEAQIDYKNLKEVIFIAVVDFKLFRNHKRYLSHHVTLDIDTHERLLKDFSFSFLELPKFHKKSHELNTTVEKWAYFFKHASEIDPQNLHEIMGKEPIIEKAFAELSIFNWTKEELAQYDWVDKQISTEQAILETARQDGVRAGKAETLRQIAKSMREKGMEIETIFSITGLSQEEIFSL